MVIEFDVNYKLCRVMGWKVGEENERKKEDCIAQNGPLLFFRCCEVELVKKGKKMKRTGCLVSQSEQP